MGNRLSKRVSGFGAAGGKNSGFAKAGAFDKTENYDYDVCDQLTCVDGVGFEYDLNGNLAKKRDDMAGDMVYKFNYANRLREVLFADGTKAQYVCKSDGMRISRTDRTGKTTKYFWDSSNIPEALNEGDEDGNITLNLFPGTGFKSTKNGSQNSTQWRWFITDHLGSVIALTDNNGITTDEYTYDEYGTITQTKGSSYNPCKYIGQQFDEETGLIYLRARYYDSQTGRFVSRDPIGITENLHLYTYTLQNPLTSVDLSGLLSFFIGTYSISAQLNNLTATLKRYNHTVWREEDPDATVVACGYKISDIFILVGHSGVAIGLIGNQYITIGPNDIAVNMRKSSGKSRLSFILGCYTDTSHSLWQSGLYFDPSKQGMITVVGELALNLVEDFLHYFIFNSNFRKGNYRQASVFARSHFGAQAYINVNYYGI